MSAASGTGVRMAHSETVRPLPAIMTPLLLMMTALVSM